MRGNPIDVAAGLLGGTVRGNPTSEVDEDAAGELRLYIDNDRRFSPQSPEGQGRSVALNLIRKMKRGTYEHHRAQDAWVHVANAAAKAYDREFGGHSFTAATRRRVARDLANDFQRDVRGGEYDHLRV